MSINTTLAYKTIFSFLMSIGLLFIFSCNKLEVEPQPDLGWAYYPLREQAAIIYDVDSTVYNDFNNSITAYHFQLKDTVTNKYIDAQGKTAYRIERYKKTGTTADALWEFQKVISRNITNFRAEEVIDNKRYVRMVFPQTLDITWNGNLYNDMDEWRHHFLNLNEPLTLNNIQLDSTLTIEQYNEVNLIREDIYHETYAKNIGLVAKEVKAVDKNISSGIIKKGYIYKMQLNSWK